METNLDLIPSQQISKTTITTSHQSDATLGKSELSVVCQKNHRTKLSVTGHVQLGNKEVPFPLQKPKWQVEPSACLFLSWSLLLALGDERCGCCKVRENRRGILK